MVNSRRPMPRRSSISPKVLMAVGLEEELLRLALRKSASWATGRRLLQTRESLPSAQSLRKDEQIPSRISVGRRRKEDAVLLWRAAALSRDFGEDAAGEGSCGQVSQDMSW